MSEKTIYFHRNDKDTWAMARLHHSLLKEIEDNPLWLLAQEVQVQERR